MSKLKLAILVLAVSLFGSAQCLAGLGLVFKMTADETNLTVGQQTTVHVWAWVDDSAAAPGGGNGLGDWQMDMDVSSSGIIEIVDGQLDLLAPAPMDGDGSSWSHNATTGDVTDIMVLKADWANSNAGEGTSDGDKDNHANYTEIFSFEIKALSDGEASYTLQGQAGNGFFGDLVDDVTYFDWDDGNVMFYEAGSENTFIVVPEPGSLLLLSAMAAAVLPRRRRHN